MGERDWAGGGGIACVCGGEANDGPPRGEREVRACGRACVCGGGDVAVLVGKGEGGPPFARSFALISSFAPGPACEKASSSLKVRPLRSQPPTTPALAGRATMLISLLGGSKAGGRGAFPSPHAPPAVALPPPHARRAEAPMPHARRARQHRARPSPALSPPPARAGGAMHDFGAQRGRKGGRRWGGSTFTCVVGHPLARWPRWPRKPSARS